MPPDAMWAVEDFTALGAMQAIKQKGLYMPEDIGLIGFANEAFSSYVTPSLSTIDQQTIKMGEEAARLFIALGKGKDNGQKHPGKIVLDPVLLIRDSSRIAPAPAPRKDRKSTRLNTSH